MCANAASLRFKTFVESYLYDIFTVFNTYW